MVYHMGALSRMVLMLKASSDYKAGVPMRSIADKYGVSYKTVHNVLSDSGVEFRKQGRKYDGGKDADS